MLKSGDFVASAVLNVVVHVGTFDVCIVVGTSKILDCELAYA